MSGASCSSTAYSGPPAHSGEGIDETLTLTRLGSARGNVERTLESTTRGESRRTQRDVMRWSSGEVALRSTAAAGLEPPTLHATDQPERVMTVSRATEILSGSL